jgi:hypothetical protein
MAKKFRDQGEIFERFNIDLYSDVEKWVIEGFVKELFRYVDHPERMKRDHPQWYEPFQDYQDGKCSLDEAHKRYVELRNTVLNVVIAEEHFNRLKFLFEFVTKKNFEKTLDDLDSGDMEREQTAAIDLTRVFKGVRYDRCKNVIDKYKLDADFLNRLNEAYFTDYPLSPKKLQRFLFKELHKADIEMRTFDEVVKLAEKKKIIPAFFSTPFIEWDKEKEALRKYISRHKESRRKKGPPRKEEREPIPKVGELRKELLDLERRLDKLEPPPKPPPDLLKNWHFYLWWEHAKYLK